MSSNQVTVTEHTCDYCGSTVHADTNEYDSKWIAMQLGGGGVDNWDLDFCSTDCMRGWIGNLDR